MSTFTRGVRFFFFHLTRNFAFLLIYTLSFFLPDYEQKVTFYSREELLDLIRAGKSFIRLGDGEIFLINYGSIHYQRYNHGIREALLRLIEDYSKESPYVLGIPRQLTKSNTWLRSRNLLHCWLPMRVVYWLRFNKTASYGDAHCFYYPHSFEKDIAPHLQDKHVVVVTRKGTIESLKENSQFSLLNVSYVESPDFNSYDVLDDIKARTNAVLKDTSRHPVLLVAIGPASKPFVYEYSVRGIQAIDVGIGLEAAFTEKDMTQQFRDFDDLHQVERS